MSTIHLFYISPSPVFLHNDKEVCIGEMAWFIWDGNIKSKSITFSYGLKQSVMSKLRNFSNITTLKNTQINNMFIDDELEEESVFSQPSENESSDENVITIPHDLMK